MERSDANHRIETAAKGESRLLSLSKSWAVWAVTSDPTGRSSGARGGLILLQARQLPQACPLRGGGSLSRRTPRRRDPAPSQLIVPPIDAADLRKSRVELDLQIAKSSACLDIAPVESLKETPCEVNIVSRHALSLIRASERRGPEIPEALAVASRDEHGADDTAASRSSRQCRRAHQPPV
jgi:hypothetical protein